MINIAEGNYPNGQLFTTPWNFWVIDNFFNDTTLSNIISLSNSSSFTHVDNSNGKIITNKNYIASKYDLKIRKKKQPELFNELKDASHTSLTKIIDSEILNKFYYIIDLVYCEPGYTYQKHLDHPEKLYSVVVYLHPNESDGTILLDQDSKMYNVTWKPNRAFVFKNNTKAHHLYTNKHSNNRYSLNIYLTAIELSFEVAVRGYAEHALDKYTE